MGGSCVFQELLRMHVVHRQKRTESQIAEEQSHPETTNRDRHDQVEPISRDAAEHGFVEVRLDIKEQIHKTHEDHPPCEPRQLMWIALERARQQHKKRNKEMEYNQNQADLLPA